MAFSFLNSFFVNLSSRVQPKIYLRVNLRGIFSSWAYVAIYLVHVLYILPMYSFLNITYSK